MQLQPLLEFQCVSKDHIIVSEREDFGEGKENLENTKGKKTDTKETIILLYL